jgi:uncharacterized protein (DUF2336 family)
VLIAGTYSEDQIWTFGEIIGRLAEDIETTARGRLAGKLASTNNASYKLTRQLAFDDSIDVAWPVLRQSERIDTETLISCAKNKSQQHLLAISKRRSVAEAVTDVLVVRGDSEVVTSIVANTGASFSNSGFLQLVRRSEGDSILAESVGLRRDIPRHIFHQLIAKASEEVRQKLQRERAPGYWATDPSGRHRRHGRNSRQVWSGLEGVFWRQAHGGKATRTRRADRG